MPRFLNPTQPMFIEGRIAGDRNMREHGRTHWNVDDWNAAADEIARIMNFHNTMARIDAKSQRFYLKKAAEYVARGKFIAARKMFDCAEQCGKRLTPR